MTELWQNVYLVISIKWIDIFKLYLGIVPVWNDFPWELCYFYIFLARFTSLRIDCTVVCLLFAVNMVIFGNVKADEYTSVQCVFSFMSRMRCYVLNILLSSPSGTVFLLCCLVRYRKTVPSGEDNNRIVLFSYYIHIVTFTFHWLL